jgi:hypothetical protein
MKTALLSIATLLMTSSIPAGAEPTSADLQHDFARQVRVEDGLRKDMQSSGTLSKGSSASGSGWSIASADRTLRSDEQDRMSAEIKAEIHDRQMNRGEPKFAKRRAQGKIPVTPAAYDADSLAADEAREARLDAVAHSRIRGY